MPAQMKAFLDATGQHWAKGALAGKFAGTFFSTASQHGGQETTALITVTYFAHHGIIYVPFGFAHPHLFDNSEVVGGSAYGVGTVAQVLLPFSFRSCDCRRLMVTFFFSHSNGDGSRKVSQKELEIAKTQGENFGRVVSTFVKGKTA